MKKKRRKYTFFAGVSAAAVLAFALAAAVWFGTRTKRGPQPAELLLEYMDKVSWGDYEAMYEMVDRGTMQRMGKEAFISRNQRIYEGIEMENMRVTVTDYEETEHLVSYATVFDTAAGEISFENQALFVRDEDSWRLKWQDGLIFPDLKASDKVRVFVTPAKRGEILDRNGRVLAGEGTASSVGIVPGKLENKNQDIKEIAKILEIEPETIEKALEAAWVKEDSFVPIKTLPKVEETDLFSRQEDAWQEKQRQEALLEIPGVMITDTSIREYPLGEAASHLTGYVQNVTAEDLENHPGQGYRSDSVIGRSGMESLFEKELKGQDGYRISILDGDGEVKKILANRIVQDGEDIRLTIDAELQTALYEQFREDKGCSVAMNPYTGEVLALVSTPAYDSNDFLLGLSQEQWDALNEDERMPLYNRFRQTWCPGSVFKPITAAVGLDGGTLNPAEDFGNEGLAWQKDTSWGNYFVTTLHAYEPVTLENAMAYSDNIYFAKAALAIGAKNMEKALDGLGFGQEVPFEIVMPASSYSNTEHIETEIQLADSGYGQGQILVNPLHLACLYTAFCNGGDVLAPSLLWQKTDRPQTWMEQAVSEETAAAVLETLKKVISDPQATGYGAFREDLPLAGKTGTAEIKAYAGDTTGTELGWFAVFTADPAAEKPVLLVSMVEDVKERGGSGYVVDKVMEVLGA